MAVTTRAAREDDLQAVLALLRQMNPEDPKVDVADAASTWRRMREQIGRCVLVAVEGGCIVATAEYMVVPNLTRGARPYMLVENVVVDAEHRRSGIGARLLRTAADEAERAGCYKVQLFADDTSTNRCFYGSCGFLPAGLGFKRRLETRS